MPAVESADAGANVQIRAPPPRGRSGAPASAGPNLFLVILLVALGALAVKMVLDRFAKSPAAAAESEEPWQPLQAATMQAQPGHLELAPQPGRPAILSPTPTPARPQARTPEVPFDVHELAPAAVGAAPPHMLGEHASRQDLVQFAKDHAAYYAAQGVPEPEAMLYISNKVREVVASQQRQRESHAARVAATPAPLPPPTRAAPSIESALPLVMKLTGDVPLAAAVGEERDEATGRRKKVSSESKEVEEYMRSRQTALGIDAAEDHTATTTAAPARSSAVSFQDPFETML